MFSRYFWRLGTGQTIWCECAAAATRGFYSLLRVTARIQNSHPLSAFWAAPNTPNTKLMLLPWNY